MGKRQNASAKKLRLRIIEFLDGKCVKCGETDEAILTFDHISSTRRHTTRDVGYSWRISIYNKEAKEGLLQLLCGFCNTSKAKPPQMSDEEYADFCRQLDEAAALLPDTQNDGGVDYDPGNDPF